MVGGLILKLHGNNETAMRLQETDLDLPGFSNEIILSATVSSSHLTTKRWSVEGCMISSTSEVDFWGLFDGKKKPYPRTKSATSGDFSQRSMLIDATLQPY